MSYKSVSLVVTDSAVDAAALAAAQTLVERESGHLDVYCIGVDHGRYEALPIGASAVALESGIAEARETARNLETWVNGQLPPVDVKIGVESLTLPQVGLDSGLGRMLRYSDLVVAPRPYGQPAGPLQVQVLESALFGSGAPVLVVPPDMTRFDPPKRIMIAWDESDESLAAIRAALPFLRAADRVDVVMVDPPSRPPERSDPGGAVGQMLARHGVRTEIAVLARTMPRIADCLNRFASDAESDLVVMGAYGHSRVREALLGGPTRDMLQDSDLPIFMSR